MSYSIKEIRYTLQGEGFYTGRPAIFCRFSGCNLWSGVERDREMAICKFCDTDFVGTDGPGGGKYETPVKIIDKVKSIWPDETGSTPYVVCTGGEPLLQLDAELINAFHGAGFEVGIETNGTFFAPKGLDWICVSPKPGADFIFKTGDELKLVYPLKGFNPEQFIHLSFTHFYIQPLAGPGIERNISLAVQYCLEHPRWKLSLQTQKILNIP